MERVIIFNKETGEVITTYDNWGNLKDNVFTNIIGEIPEGKVAKCVNLETKELILEDIPKIESEILQDRVNQLEMEMAKLIETGAITKEQYKEIVGEEYV